MSISDKEFQKLNDAYQKLGQENDAFTLKIDELYKKWYALWSAARSIKSSRTNLIADFCRNIGGLKCDLSQD